MKRLTGSELSDGSRLDEPLLSALLTDERAEGAGGGAGDEQEAASSAHGARHLHKKRNTLQSAGRTSVISTLLNTKAS